MFNKHYKTKHSIHLFQTMLYTKVHSKSTLQDHAMLSGLAQAGHAVLFIWRENNGKVWLFV